MTQGGASFPLFSHTGKSVYFLRDGKLWIIGINGQRPKPLTHMRTVLPGLGRLPLEKDAK